MMWGEKVRGKTRRARSFFDLVVFAVVLAGTWVSMVMLGLADWSSVGFGEAFGSTLSFVGAVHLAKALIGLLPRGTEKEAADG